MKDSNGKYSTHWKRQVMRKLNRESLRAFGFAVLTLFATNIVAFGQADDTAKKSEESTPEKKSASPGGASLTDVEFLLQLREAQKAFDDAALSANLPGSTRIKPKFNTEKIPEVTKAANSLLESMNRIIASDRVAALRKEETQIKKLSFLYEAVRYDPTTFAPIRDGFVSEMFDKARKEEGDDRRISALLAAYKLKEEFVDSDKPVEKTRAALEEFVREYPRSLFGLNLYMAWANNLVENGDITNGLEAYKAIKAQYHEPKLSILDSLIYRLELIGKPAEITGPTFEGQEFDIKSLKGKVVLIDFWASWCGPCMDRFEILKNIYQKYHDKGLDVVGISLDDKREDVKSVLERYTLPWVNIFFEPKETEGRSFENPLASKLQISYIPALFLIDKEGNYIGTDYPNLEKLEGAIAKSLGLDSPIPDPPKQEPAEAEAEAK